MKTQIAKRYQDHWFITLLFIGFLLASCVTIIEPPKGGTIHNPVYAKVTVRSQCGPLRASLDAVDVTPQFSGTSLQATFPNLTPGSHTLTVSADALQYWYLIPYCASGNSDTATFKVDETLYMAECRARGVPLPPDWAASGTTWELVGDLAHHTNVAEPGKIGLVYTHSDPVKRGACIAIMRGTPNSSMSGIICQSAATGYACFWNSPTFPTSGQRLVISTLEDPTKGITGQGCPVCHQGNNAFIIFPDDPLWAQVIRGNMATKAGSTFTTRVEMSSERDSAGRPRYIPISTVSTPPGSGTLGPLSGEWVNQKKGTGCASTCHENHNFPPNLIKELDDEALRLNQANFPKMPPDCAFRIVLGNVDVERCYR